MRQEMPDADEMKHVQGKRKAHWAPMPALSGATPEWRRTLLYVNALPGGES
jgi:hypothetical protein